MSQIPSAVFRYRPEALAQQNFGRFGAAKNLVAKLLARLELALVRESTLDFLNAQITLLAEAMDSRSQLLQDVFVLLKTGMKKEGFFVEFGATNGIDLSNTFLLEKKYNWAGILVEPAKCWHSQLKTNRPSSIIDARCVYVRTGEILEFNETEVGEFSTIDKFTDDDFHSAIRGNGRKYPVTTVSLLDLLGSCGAPKTIDYLSIDTEGSEYSILSTFDFSRYDVRIITCEHNYKSDREKIYNLLVSNGYRRECETLSQFDDWYVKV